MLCKHCHEQIEVGEACLPIQVGGRTHYYHPHCATFCNPVRVAEEAKNEDEEFERIARQARSIC